MPAISLLDPVRWTLACAAIIVAMSGCSTKTCSVDESNGTVTSALVYTEPTAVQRSRTTEIADTSHGTLSSMAAASRGLGRVTNESRSFDQDGQGVALDGGQIVLTSTINFDAPVEGQVVHYAVSRVTLAFDRPASAGTFDLATLHAKVCEIVKDTWTPACGAVTGTLTYRPDGSQKLDGDLVIDSTPPGDGPALSGSASFHYEVHTSTDWCPDLGGPHGVMSPE